MQDRAPLVCTLPYVDGDAEEVAPQILKALYVEALGITAILRRR